MSDKLMLYGANGYTARLIIKELIGAGIKPVLAGRNQVKISALADKHGFDHSIFALDDTDVIEENLADVTVLLTLQVRILRLQSHSLTAASVPRHIILI